MQAMQVRRVLLLFALVLGVAAIVASVSAPRQGDRTETSPAEGPDTGALLAPGPAPVAPARIAFRARGRSRTRRLRARRAAIVTVRVQEPGQVELEGLGLSAAAEPLTAARFDLLVDRPGRYRVRFTPAQRGEAETVGVLRVVRPPPT